MKLCCFYCLCFALRNGRFEASRLIYNNALAVACFETFFVVITEKNPDVNTIKKLIIPIKKLLKLVRLTRASEHSAELEHWSAEQCVFGRSKSGAGAQKFFTAPVLQNFLLILF